MQHSLLYTAIPSGEYCIIILCFLFFFFFFHCEHMLAFVTVPLVQEVEPLLSHLNKNWTNCPKSQRGGQLNWRSHLHTILLYWLVTWATEARRGEYFHRQQQHAWMPARKPLAVLRLPEKCLSHMLKLIFSRQQAFPLCQSATGTHSNNDKKCLWCRNVMQINSLLNVEFAALVAQVEFK